MLWCGIFQKYQAPFLGSTFFAVRDPCKACLSTVTGGTPFCHFSNFLYLYQLFEWQECVRSKLKLLSFIQPKKCTYVIMINTLQGKLDLTVRIAR